MAARPSRGVKNPRQKSGGRATTRAARAVLAASHFERDLIGRLEIPGRALYGIQTLRAVRNLSFSGRMLGQYAGFVRALGMLKKAAARANRKAGALPARLAGAIEDACDELIRRGHLDQFPVDLLGGGGGIGVNMNVNEVLANLANERFGKRRGEFAPVDPKTHVNASQSTADVCHCAARIAILEQWTDLGRVLGQCVTACRAKAAQFRAVVTISRTCLQDAGPVSLGSLFGGYAAALARRKGELERSVLALRKINLGGTAIGSGSGAPVAYRRAILACLNEVTGRRLALRENLYDAAQNIDDLAAVSAQLGLLAEVLIKVARDLRLLSSGPEGGFGEITLPAVQEGSSFFPGKINPVVPETLLQCCFQVLGCERAARLALESAELNLNVFEGAAAANLFDAIEMMRRAVALFVELCLKGIIANKARCRQLASRTRFRAAP